MKFFTVAITFFLAATVSAQARTGANGKAEIFTEPDNSPGLNCCLLPARRGNNDVDNLCVKDDFRSPNRARSRILGWSPRIKRVDESEEE
ncbi:hypothetical protein MCOR25_004347 [Pyricularia grisea]|uniref:Uncharacterized protein n=1 Tax=Pyricularia grisea TaxID=148305 RepID=A0A6P8BEY2_PYRGI|nr:uncharacterized protein PgNI_00324 [Pyricularia grisea]KAI6370005.1 hypothetical protein MCOR25_004347 [Pyricularia grisea]TLD15381.1 hypothetical protein PgNI_00324 [Pyricularia grisea]